MALASPASARQVVRPGFKARLMRTVKRAKDRIMRLPKRVRDRMAVHHEVSTLLKQHPHLSRFPFFRKRRHPRLRLTLGRANRLVNGAHVAEGVAFTAGKAIPDPVLQTGYLALEGAAFTGVEKISSRVMEITLLEAERYYPLYQTPLSNRALKWLHGRLQKKQHTLSLRGPASDANRYKNWHLLKQVERELAERAAAPRPGSNAASPSGIR
jgi:hypothetical protein